VGNGSSFTRAFVVQAPATLPAGVSSVTVSLSATADVASGRQPLSSWSLATLADGSPSTSMVLTAGQAGQVDLTAGTKHYPSGTYVPHLDLVISNADYGGGFLSYQVPVSVSV
jgi:hypothetical protein